MIRISTPISFFADIQLREEPRRHQCEVKHVAAFDTDAHRATYIAGVHEKRGGESANRLRHDVWFYLRNNNQMRQEVVA